MDATNELENRTLDSVEDPPVSADERDAGPVPEERGPLTALVINAFSVAMGLGIVLLLVCGPIHGLGPIRVLVPEPAMFVVLCALTMAAMWAPVSLHYRGNTYLFVLHEAPMLLGLVFLSPRLLILCSLTASVFVFAVIRRQPFMKSLFNITLNGLSYAFAAVVYREILGALSPVSFRGWAAAAAALCTTAVTTTLAVWFVMRLNGRTATARRTPIQFTMEATLTAASICLSFVVLDAAWFDPWMTLPLLLVAVLIIVAYRGYTRLSLRFASLQRLYDFSRALSSASLEPTSMSVDVLRQVCTVMRARRAQLVLAEPSGIPRLVLMDGQGAPRVEPITLDESSFVTRAITTGTAMLCNSTVESGGPESDPIAGEYRDAVVAPLMNGVTAIGAIIAIDREEELDSFDQDDLRLFEALVAHASSSLERARLVEELRYEVDSKSHQATHDMLTGLPNRMLFLTRAAAALNDSPGVAIVLLDIDRFKDVNDTLGHAIGDRLLCEVSERLLRAARGRATVARLGGDEFAFVIADIDGPDEAVAIVEDLHSEMARPIQMEGLTLAVTASAGIALAPEHGSDVELLLQRADIAMYLAKERRSSVELYSVEHDQSMRRWLMLGGLLTHALEVGSELSVAYQPIADVRSRQIVKVEALLRWNHPEHGAIPPEEFIVIAEQMGLMGQISEFVLREALAQLAAWRRTGLDIGIAINVSGREFADSSLVERVARNLQANDLPADVVTLEVTETEIMADLGKASTVLEELADLGIRIAIDDYGTGYSSLAYLHHLPVQDLKIDRSFVTNLPNEMSNAIIVRSSIAMAHSLGLTVIAEGAEDETTCAMLADAECDSIQGYYLARPMAPADLQQWLLEGAALEFEPLEPGEPFEDQVPRHLELPFSQRRRRTA
jgi:diguanylate cyclase (GGDEF)-like protein